MEELKLGQIDENIPVNTGDHENVYLFSNDEEKQIKKDSYKKFLKIFLGILILIALGLSSSRVLAVKDHLLQKYWNVKFLQRIAEPIIKVEPSITPILSLTPTLTLIPTQTIVPTSVIQPTQKNFPTKKPIPNSVKPTSILPTLVPTTAPISEPTSPPVAHNLRCEIGASPSSGKAPLTSTLSYVVLDIISNSYVIGAQWDFNGDGNWDTSLNTDTGRVNYTFPEAKSYTVYMRAQLNDGRMTGTCSTTIDVQPN